MGVVIGVEIGVAIEGLEIGVEVEVLEVGGTGTRWVEPKLVSH